MPTVSGETVDRNAKNHQGITPSRVPHHVCVAFSPILHNLRREGGRDLDAAATTAESRHAVRSAQVDYSPLSQESTLLGVCELRSACAVNY